MPATPSSPMCPVLEQLARVAADCEGTGRELLAALSAVPDPRDARGLRHRLPVILAVALSAVLSGARSFAAIGEWAADASAEVLDALGVDGAPPGESTIRRTLQRLSGDELDTGLGGWLAARTRVPGLRRALAVDGKTLRGSGGTNGAARHLMAPLQWSTRSSAVVMRCFKALHS